MPRYDDEDLRKLLIENPDVTVEGGWRGERLTETSFVPKRVIAYPDGVANYIAGLDGERIDVTEMPKPTRKNKYNARKAEADGHTFDSQKEMRRYQELKQMELTGEISDLKLQPRFILQEGFRDRTGKYYRKIEYIADFQFVRDGFLIVEDVKSVATRNNSTFRLKWKLLLHKYREHKYVKFALHD